MLLRAIYSYQQTSYQDIYFAHISGYQKGVVYVAIQVYKLTDVQSQISIALDQAACRQWSARDEKIQDHHIFQGSYLVPWGIFWKGCYAKCELVKKEKVTDHKFTTTTAPLGIWYPRYWSLSDDAWGIPVKIESQLFLRLAKRRNPGAFLRSQEGSTYIAILRMEGS